MVLQSDPHLLCSFLSSLSSCIQYIHLHMLYMLPLILPLIFNWFQQFYLDVEATVDCAISVSQSTENSELLKKNELLAAQMLHAKQFLSSTPSTVPLSWLQKVKTTR